MVLSRIADLPSTASVSCCLGTWTPMENSVPLDEMPVQRAKRFLATVLSAIARFRQESGMHWSWVAYLVFCGVQKPRTTSDCFGAS